MFRSLFVMIFNTSEIEANIFGMADDVYNTIEIFKEAATFEERIARPYKMLSGVLDCLVFMVVALMVVAVRQNRIRKPKRASGTLLPENDNENAVEPEEKDDNSIGFSGNDDNDEDNITLRPKDEGENKEIAMIGTPKWALKWLTTLRNKSFGSFYDGLFR
ncbi:uncharacterized protein [Drosophila takahashii]|uniref:uncharacterized protein isoform X2 n=1 Tax=Drosophila takahashii TaxID=29030 RepID=UPI003898E959